MQGTALIRAGGKIGRGGSILRSPAPAGAAVLLGIGASIVLAGCMRGPELSRSEAQALRSRAHDEVLARTVKRPGGGPLQPGRVGGTWLTSITNDPKTFNTLTARDSDTRGVIDALFDYLADYDPYTREFKPNLASFQIQADQAAGRLSVIYTLRDDLYWTTPGESLKQGVKVTSDDVVFWYDEVEGDRAAQQPGYAGQFVEMPDGSRRRIEIEKLDSRRFAFRFPRIVSNPVLQTNMEFGPRYLYEPAKKAKGVQGMLDLFSVDSDPKKIPSIGRFHIVEYTPGQRVVLKRNPNYWKKDANGTGYPYLATVIVRIVPDKNTEYLLFKQGNRDSYDVRPEELKELLDAKSPDYTVYDGGESLGSAFFTFNQNPAHLDPVRYRWFSQTRFRQAMSSLLNRQRIVAQVYRGLAAPALHFFARPNPFYDESIRLEYTYDPARARKLLADIGIRPDAHGRMVDPQGNAIEFEISVAAENNVAIDVANIFADELAQVGITARVRPIDFQKLVEMLVSTYDWQCVSVSLGSNYWPDGGSNVWQSSGNFHVWRPLQDKPATEWEARVDALYNEGRFTLDRERQKRIYDEYQRLLLEQLPVIYVVHPLQFAAVRNKWDNVFYDTLEGLDTTYVFLKP
jgi:peptide/nickel transport system substrate-binding protein